MFHILTFGQKNMPSHASQLSVKDRWSVIAYVRSLQNETQPVAVAEVQK
jgi:mono/diheme cytochrome c family protein